MQVLLFLIIRHYKKINVLTYLLLLEVAHIAYHLWSPSSFVGLTLIGIRQGTFHPLVLFESDFVS